MPRIRNVHQMQVVAATENSIGNEVIEVQAALRQWGYRSDIYAEQIAPDMRGRAIPFERYRPSPHDLVILHYSTASPLIEAVRRWNVPLVLVYHNVTPPEFLTGLGGGEKERARRAREALVTLREQTVLAIARSAYSRSDLVRLGFDPVHVLPLILPDTLFHTPPDPDVLARFQDDPAVKLLFVGRIVPNKRQEDVIKLLYHYRQINPQARLFLVGSWHSARRYVDWLRRFAQRLGLADAVHLCGHVSTAELAAYYRLADLFVSMSEHEGFGIPLVEAMRFGVPILAYAAAAVPETLGGAGVLVRRKVYPVIAETVHLLQTDADLRARIVARQHERERAFDRQYLLADFRRSLDEAITALTEAV